MCDVFHLDDTVARKGFQEYRTEGLLEPPCKLVDLAAVKALAVSTAECENGLIK